MVYASRLIRLVAPVAFFGIGGKTASLRHMVEVARGRRALRNMSPDRLMDLGLTRAEAIAEAKRPFWDLPDAWNC